MAAAAAAAAGAGAAARSGAREGARGRESRRDPQRGAGSAAGGGPTHVHVGQSVIMKTEMAPVAFTRVFDEDWMICALATPTKAAAKAMLRAMSKRREEEEEDDESYGLRIWPY